MKLTRPALLNRGSARETFPLAALFTFWTFQGVSSLGLRVPSWCCSACALATLTRADYPAYVRWAINLAWILSTRAVLREACAKA